MTTEEFLDWLVKSDRFFQLYRERGEKIYPWFDRFVDKLHRNLSELGVLTKTLFEEAEDIFEGGEK